MTKLTLSQKPWFLRVCSTSLLKTLWEKEKLLVMRKHLQMTVNFESDENGRKFSKRVENIVGKGEKEKLLVMSNFSFSHNAFKTVIVL